MSWYSEYNRNRASGRWQVMDPHEGNEVCLIDLVALGDFGDGKYQPALAHHVAVETPLSRISLWVMSGEDFHLRECVTPKTGTVSAQMWILGDGQASMRFMPSNKTHIKYDLRRITGPMDKFEGRSLVDFAGTWSFDGGSVVLSEKKMGDVNIAKVIGHAPEGIRSLRRWTPEANGIALADGNGTSTSMFLREIEGRLALVEPKSGMVLRADRGGDGSRPRASELPCL